MGRKQRRDLWKHRKTVSTLTYRRKPGITRVRFDMRQLADAFNRYARQMGWSCRLELVFSMEKGFVHIHCLLEAIPGWTAFKWLRAWWYKRHGQVHLDKRELYNPKGYSIYCNRQAVHTIVVTTNWPQVQALHLTGKSSLSSGAASSTNPMANLALGSCSASSTNSPDSPAGNSCLDSAYPEPVYDPKVCRPWHEPPELDELPWEEAAVILGAAPGDASAAVSTCVNQQDNDAVDKPGNQSAGQSAITDNNTSAANHTVDAITRRRVSTGPNNPADTIGHNAGHNPLRTTGIYDPAPILTPPRAGPTRAAPYSVTTAALTGVGNIAL